MIFLLEYDRPKGTLVRKEVFEDSRRAEAEKRRLQVELDLYRRHIEHEVVLLEAQDEGALHKTHRRYFEDVKQIVESATAIIGNSYKRPK